MPVTRSQRARTSRVRTRSANVTVKVLKGGNKRRLARKRKILLKDGAKRRSTTRSGREYGPLAENGTELKGNKSKRKYNSQPPLQRRRHSKENERKAQILELKQRIASISIKNRSVPETDNTNMLATELKIRLAATSDVIEEKSAKRGERIHVTTVSRRHRHVPLWDINRQQDATLLCTIKVPTVNKQKNKPCRNRL